MSRLILTLETLEINKINKHIQNRKKATMYDVSESFFTFYRQMVMLLDSFKTSTLPHLRAGQECLGSPRWGADGADVFVSGVELVVGCGVVPGSGSMSLKPTVNNENCTPRERMYISHLGKFGTSLTQKCRRWMGYGFVPRRVPGRFFCLIFPKLPGKT